MEVVVTKAFMTSPDARPARKRVAPSVDPDEPMIADIPAWAFMRHFRLGNCLTVDAYTARRKLEIETAAALASVKLMETELGEKALADAEKLALQELISALIDMDKPTLLATARDNTLSVSSSGGESVVRSRVEALLRKKLDALSPAGDEPAADLGRQPGVSGLVSAEDEGPSLAEDYEAIDDMTKAQLAGLIDRRGLAARKRLGVDKLREAVRDEMDLLLDPD